jgi:hypothetical protein
VYERRECRVGWSSTRYKGLIVETYGETCVAGVWSILVFTENVLILTEKRGEERRAIATTALQSQTRQRKRNKVRGALTSPSQHIGWSPQPGPT